MKETRKNVQDKKSLLGTDREGDIMQLTNTTDYAIRIVCYLASEK